MKTHKITKFLALLIIMGGADFSSAFALDLSGFAKSVELTISPSAIPAGTSLEGFQTLVRLSVDGVPGFSYGAFAKENGGDLAFFDAGGNQIPHEIDTWDESGESLIWVRLPSAAAGTTFYAAWGNADFENALSASSVWDGYTGVWHMSEESGTASDSTGHGLDGTPSGGRAAYNVGISDGVVGMARKNGGNGSSAAGNRAYLSIPAYDSFALGDTFTASGFFRVTGSGGWYRLFSRKGNAASGGWGQEMDSSSASTVYVYGASGAMPTVAIPDPVGNWTHLAFAYSGRTCKVYANGALLGTRSITAASENGQPLAVGCTSDGSDWSLYGDYDEVRLCAGNPSAERVAADYATATDASFLSYSAVSDDVLSWPDLSAYSKFVQIRASATALPGGGELADFPALVRLSESIDGFRYADFRQSSGGDLLFTDENGVALDHEVDVWDESGESLVWVRIPSFANGKAIFAHYGCGEASGRDSTGTWRGFKGVWHMNKSGAEAEPDASGNGLDAVPSSNSLTTWGGDPVDTTTVMTAANNGPAGFCRRNQSSVASYMHNWLAVPSCSLSGSVTLSGWFKVVSLYSWHRFLTRKNGRTDAGGFDVEWYYYGDDKFSKIYVTGSGSTCFPATVGAIKDSWTHLAFVYDGPTASVYVNGVLAGTGKVDEVADNDNPIAIGGNIYGTEPSFEGYYDEVRFATSALSAERIAADCATVTDAGFFAYGGAQSAAATLPSVFAPTLSLSATGEPTATVVMDSDASAAKVRLTSESGEAVDFDLNGGAAVSSGAYSLSIPCSSLPSVGSYAVTAVAVNANGGEVESAVGGFVYNGVFSVEKAADADEDGLVTGAFTVSRTDAYGDLVVNYALGGTAVAGTDYEGDSSGSVTIRNGETSATVTIAPKVNAAVNADTAVDFSFASGYYPAQSATATMTIRNLAPAATKEFRRRLDFTVAADFLADGETLENFPVLVRLSENIDGFAYSDFEWENGGDMLFVGPGGAALPSEVDTWNEGGESLVWVVVPTLAKGTRIKMFYGNGVNPSGHYRAVWPGYAGVWHMGEDGGTAFDSTANGLDAEPVQNEIIKSGWASDLTATDDGAVGRGRVNQGGTTYYSVSDYYNNAANKASARRSYLKVPSYDNLAIGSQFAVSGWFRTTGGTEWYEAMVSRHESGVSGGWRIERMPTSGGADSRVNIVNGGGVADLPDMRGAWVHLVFAYDGKAFRCFANGKPAAELTLSSAPSDNGLPLTFGHNDNVRDGMAYYGQYDEIRLKRGTASASWAKAEYLSVTDAEFATPGSVRPASGGLAIFIR